MKVAWAAACLTLFSAGIAECEEATATAEAEALLAPYRPEILATAQLMYSIGACERHIKKATVDWYIREYMAGSPPKGLEGQWREQTQAVYSRLYVEGRGDALKLDLDATQCQRVLDAGVADLIKATASRKAAQGSVSQR